MIKQFVYKRRIIVMSYNGINIDLDNLLKLTETQKVAFLRVFVKMASIDGHFDETEKVFVKKIADDLGISPEQTEDIMKNLDNRFIIKEASLIKDRSVALELIKEMCLLGHADNDLSDEEVLFIGEVGQAMGIELEKIEQISNWVIDYLIWNDQGKIIFEKI